MQRKQRQPKKKDTKKEKIKWAANFTFHERKRKRKTWNSTHLIAHFNFSGKTFSIQINKWHRNLQLASGKWLASSDRVLRTEKKMKLKQCTLFVEVVINPFSRAIRFGHESNFSQLRVLFYDVIVVGDGACENWQKLRRASCTHLCRKTRIERGARVRFM